MYLSGLCVFFFRFIFHSVSSVAGLYFIYSTGVPLINFVDDMIDNHLLVGITRAANTVMMVGGMAFGNAFALRLLVMNDVTIVPEVQ